MFRSFPGRLAGYLGWAVISLTIVGALLHAHYPHWGLLAGALCLLLGVGMLSVGELRLWASRRGVENPRGFALGVWGLSSVLWTAYVLLVILPVAFFTSVPSTSNGRGVLAMMTFLPLAALYAAVWKVRSGHAKRPMKR